MRVGAAPSTRRCAQPPLDRRPPPWRPPAGRRATPRRSRRAARASPARRRARRTARAACDAGRAPCRPRATASPDDLARHRPGPNARIVRRACSACSGDSRNRSSVRRADELARPRPASPSQSIPRTTAAGTRSALPITMPAAAATWSASATDRHLELAPAVIRRSRADPPRGHPGDADRDVDEALAPGPTERVGDHDRRAAEARAAPSGPRGGASPNHRGPRAAASAARRRRWRRPRRRSHRRTRARVSTMTRSPRRATTRSVSAAIDRVAIRGRGDAVPPPWTPPSGSPRRRRPRPGAIGATASARSRARSSPGAISGSPSTRSDADRHPRSSSAPRATASARASSTMSVSIAAHRSPRRLDRGIDARVDVVQQPRRTAGPGTRSATPAALTSIPTAGISLSAIPATGAPPTIPLTPTTPIAPRRHRVADPGHREDRPDRHHRVRRAEHDGVRRRRSPRARPARAAPRRPRRTGRRSRRRAPRRLTQYSWKCRSSDSRPARRRHRRSASRCGSSLTGSSRAPTPNRARDPTHHLRQRRALGQQAASGTDGCRDRGRPARTSARSAVEGARAPRSRGRSRRADPSRVRDRRRRRANR